MTRTAAALGLACVSAASSRYPAVDPPVPAIVYNGGHFLRHPRVVTVTFKGDDASLVRKLEEFGACAISEREAPAWSVAAFEAAPRSRGW